MFRVLEKDTCETVEKYELNPYDSFMRKHLQHYGYFTGRNQNYRNSFRSFADWEKNHIYQLDSDSDSDSDSDGKAGRDNRTQEELLRTTQLVYNFEAGKMVPRLREPRNLYALSKEPGPQQAARWPADLQVENGRINHIRYIPPEPEPIYKLTGLEKTPMVRGEEYGGKVVFSYEPKASFFVRSRVGGSRNGCDAVSYIPTSPEDTTLIFESRFESGNLAKAIQVGEYDYELYLRYDLFTSKHTQWYYFRVKNTRPNIKYRFTIVNFMKPDSLYNYGMKPLMYSDKLAQQKKIGWLRAGTDIKYYRNNLKYETAKGDKSFYSLTWTTQFTHGNDDVYFAHCYPYTYTDLQDYLLELSNDPIKSRICKQRVLCRTIAGNLVYLLTITSPSQHPDDLKHKKAVVLTSRVHPGESNSSWMMKGFLDYLTGNSADAKLLRDTFIFKIVPMLNPDGVIVGNYRCSLAGRDLNRNYKTMLKDAYPSVWHTRSMIRKLLQEREIVVYCDLHGHSRRQNVFIYGCENKHNNEKRLRERIFPCMLSKNAPHAFSFNSCKFKVQKSKEGTGRIVVWNMGVLNSFTMEATFCGSSLGKKKGSHFSVADFESMGYHFCDTLLDYCDPDTTKCANIYLDLEEKLRKEILSRMEKQGVTSPNDLDMSDIESDLESSDGGSDSSVSDGPPVQLQYSSQRTKKKKKLKSRKERDRANQKKDDGKKVSPTSQSVMATTVTDIPTSPVKKPNSGHVTSHSKQDQVQSQTLKYSMTHKRPQSTEASSRPVEKVNEKPKTNEYLEALTVAYLKNGIPLLNDPVPHLRYSGSHGSVPNLPFNLEGLCPHHEQSFAAQYVAQQLQTFEVYCEGTGKLKGSKVPSRSVVKKSDLEARPVLTNIRLHSGIKGNSYFKIWKLCARPSPEKKERVEDLRPKRTFPKHLFDLSSTQNRQNERGKLLKQHPNPFDEKKGKQLYPKSQVSAFVNVNDEAFDDDEEEDPDETPPNTSNTEPRLHLTADSDDRNRSDSKRSPTNDSVTDKNGRKSRIGMYSDDGEETVQVIPATAITGKLQNPKHTKTVKTTPVLNTHGSQNKSLRSLNSSDDVLASVRSLEDTRYSLNNLAYNHSNSFTGKRPASFRSPGKNVLQQMINDTNDEIKVLKKEIKQEIQAEKVLAKERKEISVLQRSRAGFRENRGNQGNRDNRGNQDNSTPVNNINNNNSKKLRHTNSLQSNDSPFDLQDVERFREASSSSNSSQRRKSISEASAYDIRELPPRNKSAKSCRQVIEATPTRISLMISSDHQDLKSHFLPLHNTMRPPFLKPYKRKF